MAPNTNSSESGSDFSDNFPVQDGGSEVAQIAEGSERNEVHDAHTAWARAVVAGLAESGVITNTDFHMVFVMNAISHMFFSAMTDGRHASLVNYEPVQLAAMVQLAVDDLCSSHRRAATVQRYGTSDNSTTDEMPERLAKREHLLDVFHERTVAILAGQAKNEEAKNQKAKKSQERNKMVIVAFMVVALVLLIVLALMVIMAPAKPNQAVNASDEL